MTEALPLPPPHAAEQPQADPTVEISIPRQFDTPAALITEETVEDDDGVIACICEFNIDDGNTIQCDQCSRWQHIACYYPPPKKVPDVDQKHYCVDCVPQPELDPRKAADRQRRALDQHNVVKRPATKPSKKKVKDSPSLTAQTNGWSDRHPHIHSHDRKSASPRDQPPPAKKPKILHRSTNSANLGRRRTGTSNAVPTRSPSKSPEMDTSAFIPQYSEGFLHLFKAQDDQIEMSTNLMDNLSLTAQLSDWVTDPDALSKATGGLTPSEVFKRWDASMEDIPGRPEVTLHYVEDTSFQADGITPTWAQLIIEEPITTGTFIGELRGRIGHKDDYIRDGDSRWLLLNHPEPCVFFHPQLPICIDARQEGTRFRYVRRSCQPNAELQTIITEGTEYHFCFMATREIQAGEEVTVAWQVPDLIRDRINSSLRMSNNFQPKTREYISTWVSNVLSNCGPCACNHQNACLMAHYDRRGRTPPSLPAKPVRRKRRAVALEPGTADRSRSASEARKADPEEETSVSRSASGSQVSASRDITPHTHIPGGTSTKVMPELSERERKKLMRTEELFRRQEAESGRQKKKRNSSSNIDTLGANASVSEVPCQVWPGTRSNKAIQKNPSLPNGSTSRYIDAGTSSSGRFDSTSRIAGVKRKAGAPPRGPRRDDSQPSRAANYVDASVQCDLSLGQDARDERRRPQRRYISVTQRLLERCVSHTSHAKLPELPTLPSQATTPAFERMDIDQEHKPEMTTNGHPEAQPEAGLSRTGDGDTAMIDADRAPEVKAESPDLQQRPKQEIPVSPSSPNLSDREESHIAQPLAPMESQSTPQEPKDSSSPIPSSTHPTLLDTGPNHRPLMHLEMPPPPSSTTLNAAAAAAFAPMSSQNVLGGPTLSTTPGLLPIAQSPLSLTTPLAMFSPSVTASVLMSPSPVRKKMSLSDYTKRSKAARESGGAGDGPTPVATPAGGASEAAPWSDGGVVASSTIGTVEGEVQGPTSSESVPTLATAAAPAETLADPLSAADDPAATAGDAVKVEAEDDDAGTATALPVAADAPRPPPATPMPTVAAAEDHAKVDGDEPPQPDTVAAGEDPA